jgi:hypothetical protein
MPISIEFDAPLERRFKVTTCEDYLYTFAISSVPLLSLQIASLNHHILNMY